MNTLHLIHQYLPEHIGGTELYTQQVTQGQVAAGHRAAVFYPSIHRTRLTANIDPAGVRVYGAPVGKRSAGQVFSAVYQRGGALLAAWRHVLEQEQPDLVHIQHLMGIPPALVRELATRAIPYVITWHDYWYGCANAQLYTNDSQQNCHGPQPYFANCGRCALARAGRNEMWLGTAVGPLLAYRQKLLRPLVAGAAAVITPTQFVQQMYSKMGFPTGHVVHIRHGIQRPPILPTPPTPPNHLRLVYVGGLAPQKGVHTLVAAFNQLPSGAELHIFGDESAFPDYVADLRRMATHKGIVFGGRLPHEQIWAHMASASLVAIPTHWYEASSLVLDEGFAVGTPAIASQLGVFPEKVRDGVDGVLVPPADVGAWAWALRRLVDAPAVVAGLRANVRPPFTAEAHLASLLELYGRVKR